MAVSIDLSINTLNANGKNTPIKRHGVTEWIKKQDPSIHCLSETNFRPEDKCRWKVKGWKSRYHANECQRKWGSNTYITQNRL